MSSGKIVQIIGAVIDVEFPRDSVPRVYDALTVDGKATTLEVQQQLGDGVVRTIAQGYVEAIRNTPFLVQLNQITPIFVTFAVPETQLAQIRQRAATGQNCQTSRRR